MEYEMTEWSETPLPEEGARPSNQVPTESAAPESAGQIVDPERTASEPVFSEPEAPLPGEDTVLLVEPISGPGPVEVVSPTEVILPSAAVSNVPSSEQERPTAEPIDTAISATGVGMALGPEPGHVEPQAPERGRVPVVGLSIAVPATLGIGSYLLLRLRHRRRRSLKVPRSLTRFLE